MYVFSVNPFPPCGGRFGWGVVKKNTPHLLTWDMSSPTRGEEKSPNIKRVIHPTWGCDLFEKQKVRFTIESATSQPQSCLHAPLCHTQRVDNRERTRACWWVFGLWGVHSKEEGVWEEDERSGGRSFGHRA